MRFLIIILMFLGFHSFACDCNSKKGFSKEVEIRDVIFEGTILSVDTLTIIDTVEVKAQKKYASKLIREAKPTHYPLQKYKVQVKKVYKGNFTSEIITLYASYDEKSGTCLKIGRDYYVYGNYTTYNQETSGLLPYGDNILGFEHCSRTTNVNTNEFNKLKNL